MHLISLASAAAVNHQYQYVEGQFRPHFPALLAGYQARSDAVAASPWARLNLSYGPHDRQRFDHFPANGHAQGALLFFHAGYWQSRDKSNFRFLAERFQAAGFHLFAFNYPLCPEVSLAELEQAVMPSVAAVQRELAAAGALPLPLALLGHSAGAHLAALIALAGSDGPGTSVPAVDGVLGISGVYDPEPLLTTTLNARLQLDSTAARRADASRRVTAGAPPGWWIVGADETESFSLQNEGMHTAWSQAGNRSHCSSVAGADHFTVLEAVAPAPAGQAGPFEAWWGEVAACHRARRGAPDQRAGTAD